MGKNKLARFEENRKLPNVIQPSREDALGNFELKGKWRERVFKNNNPIVLELGCGKGEYSVGMAKAFPDKNFIGVDIKGARFWFGAKEAVEKGAKFIVTPGFNLDVVKWCVDNNIDVIPGTVAPSDIEAAMNLGLSVCKFFPAEAYGGVKTLKALAGPYANIKFMPTGGVSENNMNEYLHYLM